MSLITLDFLELDTNPSLVVLKNPYADLCFDSNVLVLSCRVLLDESKFDFVLLAADDWIYSKSFSDELNQCCLQVLRLVSR